MTAYVYPLLDIVWTLLVLAIVAVVVFLIIYALIDNFSRHDHGGWSKAGWCILIIILPLIGTLIYYITRAAES